VGREKATERLESLIPAAEERNKKRLFKKGPERRRPPRATKRRNQERGQYNEPPGGRATCWGSAAPSKKIKGRRWSQQKKEVAKRADLNPPTQKIENHQQRERGTIKFRGKNV